MSKPTSITLRRVIEGREYHAQASARGFLSLTEAAHVARVDFSTVWRWLHSGRLSGRSGTRPVRVSELLRFLRLRAATRVRHEGR